MGFKEALLQKSKRKSQSSSALHSYRHHNTDSSTSTPRRSTAEDQPAPDSYEAFLLQAERDERDRLELLELESRVRRRNESWNSENSNGGKSKRRNVDGGTRAWLIGNGLSR